MKERSSAGYYGRAGRDFAKTESIFLALLDYESDIVPTLANFIPFALGMKAYGTDADVKVVTCGSLSLSADHLKALDEASAVDLGFPYDLYAKEAVRAIVTVGYNHKLHQKQHGLVA